MSDALVSVIIRTIHRPTLPTAIKSVEKQTYSNLEIVLVDASGCGFPTPSQDFSFLPVVTCSQGTNLGYGDAANLGLDHANGDYLIFLDDDDFFDAEHIASLLDTLANNPHTLLAYSGTRKIDKSGKEEGYLTFPFNPIKLYQRNVIQIGAALFSRKVLDKGCRFDSALKILEDWDFWLQALQHGPFVWSGKNTNNWCVESGNSGAGINSNFNAPLVFHVRDRIFAKWQEQYKNLLDIFHQHFAQGFKAQKSGDATEAERQYIAALKLDFTNSAVLNMLAMLYVNQHRFTEADQLMRQAITTEPNNPDLHFNRALLWRAAGKPEESIKAIDKVLEIAPNHDKALSLRNQLCNKSE